MNGRFEKEKFDWKRLTGRDACPIKGVPFGGKKHEKKTGPRQKEGDSVRRGGGIRLKGIGRGGKTFGEGLSELKEGKKRVTQVSTKYTQRRGRGCVERGRGEKKNNRRKNPNGSHD